MVSVEGGCQEAIFKQGKWGDNVEVCQTAQELHWKSVATGLTERWIRILKFWFKSWSKRYKDECLQRSIIVWGCIPDSGVRDFVKIDGIIRTIRFWSTMKYHMAEFLFFSTTVIPNTLQENQNTIIKAQTSTLLKKIILTETRAKSSQDRSAEYSLFVKTTLFSKNMILFLRVCNTFKCTCRTFKSVTPKHFVMSPFDSLSYQDKASQVFDLRFAYFLFSDSVIYEG